MLRYGCIRQLILAWAAIVLLPTLSVFAQDGITAFLFGLRTETVGYGGDVSALEPAGYIAADARGEPFTTIDLGGSYSDLYRPGGMEGPGSSWLRDAGLTVTHQRRDWLDWSLGMRVRTTAGASDVNLDDQTSIRGQTSRTGAAAVLRGRKAWLAGYADVGWRDQGRPESAFGLRADPLRWVSAAVSWQRRAQDLDVLGVHGGDQLDLTVDAATETVEGWLRVDPWPWIGVEASVARRLWIAGNTQGLTPTLLPWGDDLRSAGFVRATWRGMRLSLGARWFDAGLQAYGRKGEYNFAKLTKADLGVDSRVVQLKVPLGEQDEFVVATGEWGWIDGAVRGHTEFWPWTSGWIDYLGLRRYGRGEFGAQFTRLHAGWQQPVSERVIVQAGVQTVALTFDRTGEFEHWRPAVLIFGKEDVQLATMKLRQVTVAQLNLGVVYQGNGWSLAYAFSQLLPVSSAEWREAGEGEPSDPSTGGGGGRVSEYGGATHVLRVTVVLD